MNTLVSAPAPPDNACTLVFGGGSGIGQAFARAHADTGTRTVVLGRNAARLAETAGDRPIVTHPLDMRQADQCAAAVTGIEAAHGPVGNAVICAAIYPKGHFIDQPAAEFDDTFITNILGVANAIRAVLPGMLARYHGRIVVIGTLADLNPLPGSVAYSASKGALHTLVRGIAGEIDRDRFPDVLINEMGPRPTRTAMSPSGQPPEEAARHIQTLIDRPAGSVSGAFFLHDRQVHLDETWKGTLKRKLGLRG